MPNTRAFIKKEQEVIQILADMLAKKSLEYIYEENWKKFRASSPQR